MMHAMSCTSNALSADYYLCYVLLHRKMTGATGESVTFTLPTGTTQLVTLSCILLGNLHAQWANDPPLLLRMLPALKSDYSALKACLKTTTFLFAKRHCTSASMSICSLPSRCYPRH